MFGRVLDGIKGFIVVLMEGPSVCVDTVVVTVQMAWLGTTR